MKRLVAILALGFFLTLALKSLASAEEQIKKGDAGEVKQEVGASSNAEEKAQPAQKEGNGVSAEQVRAKTQEAYEAARAYMSQQMKEYERTLNVKLDELNQQLEQLRENAEEKEPEVRARLEEDMKEVEQRKAVLQKKLDELQKQSMETLKDAKERLNSALRDIERFVDEQLSNE